MKRFVEGLDRGQSTLFPASLDDYVVEDNPVRAVTRWPLVGATKTGGAAMTVECAPDKDD
jgi:hypothetical protein